MNITWYTDSTLTELSYLAMAFVLSAVIGFERHRRLKSAGIRTHTLVGVGSALFTLVSAYGFQDASADFAIVDPTRIAAQIVSGIGFIGAGVIFVRQNAVAGLTTAASIWLTAAIGMACAAGMPLLALAATGFHLITVTILGRIGAGLRKDPSEQVYKLRYREGFGALRNTLALAADAGFEAIILETRDITKNDKKPRFEAKVQLRNGDPARAEGLTTSIMAVPGVSSIELATEDVD